MREAFESESKSTGKDRLLITMAVPASLEYAGKVIVVTSHLQKVGKKLSIITNNYGLQL